MQWSSDRMLAAHAILLRSRVPGWVMRAGGVPATLDFDLAQDRYFGAKKSDIAISQTTGGYVQTSGGLWLPKPPGVLRLSDLGLLVEESRTNSIRNNSMQGAAAGSPGTLPTNWVAGATGLTQTVVGTGTQNGIEYIDIRWAGTTGGTSGFYAFESGTAIAASAAQTWTQSVFLAVVGGSTANITSIQLNPRSNTAAGANVANNLGSDFKGSLSSSLARITHSPSLGGGGTVACVQPFINFTWASSAAIDITLRIGWPQLELGAFATSPIRTTNAAATRAADTITLATGSWFNASAGTVFAQFLGPPVNLDRTIWQLSDGGFNNRILLRAVHEGATTNVFGVNGGVSDGTLLFVGAPVQNTAYKIAAAYSLNDFAGSKNAATVVTDTTAAVPSMTTLYIGQENSVNTSNTYIQRLSYFNSRLSNATLQSITT